MFTASQLHVNQALTDIAVRYSPDEQGYLWNKLLPMKVESKRSNIIRAINQANLLRRYDLRSGRGSGVLELQFKADPNLMYNCVDYAAQVLLSNTESAEADDVLMYAQEQIYHCWIAMQIGMEGLTFDTLRDPSVITQGYTLSASQLWDLPNSPSSNPLSRDLIPACAQVKVRTGHAPNIIVMHEYVWRKLQVHNEVLSRGGVHPTGNAIVSLEQMEKILEVPPGTIRVTSQFYNKALEDQAADFRSFIGPDVLIAYVEPPQTRTFGLGCSFMFQGAKSSGMYLPSVEEIESPFLVLEFPDNGLRDPRGATIHRIVGGLDQKVLNAQAAVLLKGVVDGTNATLYQNFLLS